jgi:protein-S-isoprenylcysteine O-methyltransferase Ste14
MNPVLRRILGLLFMYLLQAGLLFGASGNLRWAAAWWYLGLYFFMLLGASVVMIPGHKEVIAERGRGTRGAKKWDLVLVRIIAVPSLGLLVVAGLDQRFGWTIPLPVSVLVAGGIAFVLGYFFVLWAMHANPFFSQVVRIQSERGHHAVDTGPYGVVRHPGYLGMIFSFLGSVLILGSAWGWVCYLVYLLLVVIRTALEDATLQRELPGYAEYARQVHFRLVPGVW